MPARDGLVIVMGGGPRPGWRDKVKVWSDSIESLWYPINPVSFGLIQGQMYLFIFTMTHLPINGCSVGIYAFYVYDSTYVLKQS